MVVSKNCKITAGKTSKNYKIISCLWRCKSQIGVPSRNFRMRKLFRNESIYPGASNGSGGWFSYFVWFYASPDSTLWAGEAAVQTTQRKCHCQFTGRVRGEIGKTRGKFLDFLSKLDSKNAISKRPSIPMKIETNLQLILNHLPRCQCPGIFSRFWANFL